MTNEKFIAVLSRENYSHKINDGGGVTVTHRSPVYLRGLTTLPKSTKFENKGSVYLSGLTTLPKSTKFENKGYVDLRGLTTLPKSTKFENQGSVDLSGLTTLPKSTKFENKGSVYLRDLDRKSVKYLGKQVTIRCIDGLTMIITSTKTDGDATIMRAKYLKGGPIKDLPKCYVVQIGEYYSHGDTIHKALIDARFKHMQKLLTGACSQGTERFLNDNGLSKLTEMSIPKTVELTRGAYGGDVVERYFGGQDK